MYFRIFFGFIFLFISNFSFSKAITEKTIIYSKNVKDSFEVYISKDENYNVKTIYNVVYYCDANLKFGKILRQFLSLKNYEEKIKNTIFVGIGHIGNFHTLRRRDFILPLNNVKDSTIEYDNYGQIENFYQFIKTELIPMIDSSYNSNAKNNSILGHSLSGLFTCYCLFKNEALFKYYYALSPSLWINKFSIYNFNNITNENSNQVFFYFSTGGLEFMNHIKKGTNQMKNFMEVKKYQNLIYKYDVHKWKTHHSQIRKSLEFFLK